MSNSFDAKTTLTTSEGTSFYWSLPALEKAGLGAVSTMPFTLRIMLESLLRNVDGRTVTEADVAALAAWTPGGAERGEVAYRPARVLLQDFTGVPAVVDLAAMREAVKRLGGDPKKINPLIPADLVIDHSMQVDSFGLATSPEENARIEFARNRERYEFLKWGQNAFGDFRVVPPATGIIHQVNLEFLADVVARRKCEGGHCLLPDTLVGTDSHTTMINGLGVLGWGVGGIEAEAAMLGQPLYMLVPKVVGVKLTGALRPGVTATDLVLLVTQILRKHGVVDKLVEFYGPGVASLALPDRAVLANMAPEYGATAGFFPVDAETLNFLRLTGRPASVVERVEAYTKAQGLFLEKDAAPVRFDEHLEIDMSTAVPAVAGPKRPQDRLPLGEVKNSFHREMAGSYGKSGFDAPKSGEGERSDTYGAAKVTARSGDVEYSVTHGAVAIASITSCTNTSSPALMLAAGLVAKKAVERGLGVRPWVKTSLAPGSRVVTDYLRGAGLMPYLEALRFHVVGYGCATCIGNSGPLPEAMGEAVTKGDLVAAAVLSGNRNFEGRVNPLVKANYLASPPLVVAYALAGTVDIDLETEPLGFDSAARPVYLKDVWPSRQEVAEVVAAAVGAETFAGAYGEVFAGDERWRGVKSVAGELYAWEEDSTYIRNPPFFTELTREPVPPKPIRGARVLAMLGDSVTTDHISPAGDIAKAGPAAAYLSAHGVEKADFNSYGARRGNHEVMMRGTFANVRIKNLMLPGTEGGVALHIPSGKTLSIFDAAMEYAKEETPLIVLAGSDYGMGSSRDWAAKGTRLLGVRAVIAKSFERIHRSNLVGMGILPLEFTQGETPATLGLTGLETFEILGLEGELTPGMTVEVKAVDKDGGVKVFKARTRLDTPVDVDYYKNGGILQTVIRGLL